jgi:hypothetical protein
MSLERKLDDLRRHAADFEARKGARANNVAVAARKRICQQVVDQYRAAGGRVTG